MHLHCQSCGTPIQANDMNLATTLAKCRSCNAVMNFPDPVRENPPTILVALSSHIIEVPEALPPAACRPRDRVPQPKNVRVRDGGNALEISSRLGWPKGMGCVVLFCVVWDTCFVGCLVIHLLVNPLTEMGWPTLLAVAFAVVMTYYLAGILLNRTVVRVDSVWVRVWHGPIPWRGGRRLARAKIQQLYSQGRLRADPVVFDVMALLRTHRRVRLLRDLSNRDLAEFIARTLEVFLALPDRRSVGEGSSLLRFCQSCGIQIQADDVNLATALAKCWSCHAVVNFADGLGVKAQPALSAHLEAPEATRTPPEESAAHRPRPRVPQPKTVRVRDRGYALDISSRWYGRDMGLVFFCIFWDGFLAFFYVLLFTLNAPPSAKLFPLLHVSVGIPLTYYVAAMMLNRTMVRADSQRIRVWHGPVPWFGRCVLPSEEIQQLYCWLTAPSKRGKGTPKMEIEVKALLRDNCQVTVLRGLHDRDQALFIEQTLEEYLGIADRPVPGELPR